MIKYTSTNLFTPWGKADRITTLSRGFHWVTTPRHGGYMLSSGLASKYLPDYLLNKGFVGMPFNNYFCYEEDSAFAHLEYYILTSPGSMNFDTKLKRPLTTYLISRGFSLEQIKTKYLFALKLECDTFPIKEHPGKDALI